MSEKLLSISNLKTYFYTLKGTVKAVDGVDLEVGRGETVGIVGETGSGKSVTALSIMRLVPEPPGKIVDGEILFKGENLLEKTSREMRDIRGKNITMIFQEPMTCLNPVLSIGDQISEVFIRHRDMNKAEAIRASIAMIKNMGIADPQLVVRKFPHELSGGMRQRVMIAIALACKPELLIADEPTTALDVTVKVQILELMKNLIRDYRTSLLFITHNLGVIAEMCDRVYVLYAGHVMEHADVISIFKNSKHPYTTGLLNCIPKIGTNRRKLEDIPGSIPNMINPPTGCRFSPRCKHAKSVCKRKRPDIIEIEKGHYVACHIYG
jgi:oligopeptide/dipeptide ABC transporter ATP-binding protein